MRLLIINYVSLPLPPVKGGAVEYLVDAFLKSNEEKHTHDITVYSIYDKNAEKESADYKYTEFKYVKIETLYDKIDRIIRYVINKFTNMYIGSTYIKKVIKSEKDFNRFDAVIIENAPEFALKISKSFKGKLILHLHNDRINCKTKNAKKIFDLYDEIYTISNTLGEYVQTIQRSDKVKTLYNGIDLERFTFDVNIKEKVRRKYNIESDDFVFMFSGRIVPEKGVLELAQAFSKLKGNKLKLLIVGGIGYSREDENDYIKRIKNIGDERIIFTGFIPYSEIQQIYTIPDAGVVPSIIMDSFNLTVIEFLANGVPVVISDRGAMKELVNEKCSVIAKFDDHFVNNIYDALSAMMKVDFEEMSKEAKRVSEKFSIERYCERFNELLECHGGIQ